MYIRYVRNHFHGQKTFCLVGGSLSWSETPYFHKVGPGLKGAGTSEAGGQTKEGALSK